MEDLAAFLEMGGYGRFVWPAFGLTIFVLVGLLFISFRTLRSREAAFAMLQASARRMPSEAPHEAKA